MPTSTPAPNLTFTVYQDATKEWRWRLTAGNHKIIATSGESYKNRVDCLVAVALVRQCATADIQLPS